LLTFNRGVIGMSKPILNTLVVAAALAATTVASLGAGWVDDFVAGAIGKGAHVRPAYVAAPEPGYIADPDYTAALPTPNCHWMRMPIYDSDHSVIGWRGRPVAVCPQPKVSADLTGSR
jgi:hypothetical protein